MANVLAWGANPRKVSKKGHSSASKGKHVSKKRKKGRSKASHGKKKNPSRKHGKKHGKKRNPGSLGSLTSSAKSVFSEALGIALGAVTVKAVAQNIIPSSWRTGYTGHLVKAGVGLGLGWLAGKIGPTKRFAKAIALGGVVSAIADPVGDLVLPKLAFNPLGETRYFGELDTRVLQLVGGATQPARPLGFNDNRVVVRGGRAPLGLPG